MGNFVDIQKKSHPQALQRSLSLCAVVLFGLAFMAITTVFSTYGLAIGISKGMITGAYIVALFIMLFTAYSYGVMASQYPIAGSAYSYVQRVIHPNAGFLVGWAVMMDYLFLPMVNFIIFGMFFHDAFPQIPEWVFIVGLLIFVTALNLKGIQLTVTTNFIVIAGSLLFMALFSILAIIAILNGEGTGTLLNLDPIINLSIEDPLKYIIAGASLLCFSFLGFDSVTAFSEETQDPQTTIPKAIFYVTLIGGVVFISVSYLATLAWPDYHTFTDLDAAASDIALLIGGKLIQALFLTAVSLGILGSALSSQASASRILFAMGRDGQLPKKLFGKLHPKYKTPTNNILIMALISLSAIFLSLGLVASLINFGAFIAFIMVNLCVITLYFKKKKRGLKNIIFYILIPFIGAALDFMLFINLDHHSLLLGALWFLGGIIYLLFLTKGFKKDAPTLQSPEQII